MEALTNVRERARDLLTVEDGPFKDLWLWEHADRVSRLTLRLSTLPEYADQDVNQLGVAVAGLFSHAGWAVQARQGQCNRWQILARPTNGVQRELAASVVQEELSALVSADVLHVTVEAIRKCSDRYSELIEAQILSEAENLADIGIMEVLRQFRQAQAEGRTTDHIVAKWQRQKEYQYWEARISDCLRSAGARRLAQQRLEDVERFVQSLIAECQPGDIEAPEVD